jgi:hypothetical protein
MTMDSEVQATRLPYDYAHNDPLDDGDLTGDDSPTPEEISFSNWYTSVLAAAQKELERKHVGWEERALFSQVATYYYFAVKAEIAANDENTEYVQEDTMAYQHEYQGISPGLFRYFSSLLEADKTTGWSGVIKNLAELVRKLYGIRIILHHFP